MVVTVVSTLLYCDGEDISTTIQKTGEVELAVELVVEESTVGSIASVKDDDDDDRAT